MSRKDLYENKLQMDYFSEDYIRFEEDFQKCSSMALNQKNYFKLNKENTKDGRDRYFYFLINVDKENTKVRKFKYIKSTSVYHS